MQEPIGATSEISSGIKFINPEEIISELEITEGMSVGDFGAGNGYFAFPLAKKVGSSGRVYALDILREKLETIESQAKVLGLGNITVKRANLEMLGGSKLEDGSLDWVFLVNMLFQNKDKALIISESARVLKKGGKILIVEWSAKKASFGPEGELRVTRNELSELALNSGLSFSGEIKISDFHFGIILEK